MPDTDQSIDDLKSRIDRSRRRSWLLTILATVVAVVATVGFAAFSINGIIKKNNELTARNSELEARSGELFRNLEDYETVKFVFNELLAKLSEAEGVDYPKYDINMKSLVKQATERIDELDRQIGQIEGNKLDKPVQPGDYTESEKEAIREAIKVEQTVSDDPKGRKGGRKWYKIAYKVTMEPRAEPVTHKNIIDHVEYRFNERWYQPSTHTRYKRTEDFVYSVRVWGVTAVTVAIFVTGFDEPIIRQSLMSLNKTSIF